MKKQLLFLAAVAALAACSETDNFKETAEAPIDFSEVFIEKATKAPFTDVASLKASSFGVFGSKTKQNNAVEKVFGKSSAETNGGAEVSWNATSNKWTYSPIRYWDKGATSYHFYAYAPYNSVTTGDNRLLGTVTWSESTANSFKIEGFKQNTTVANMVDILTDLENQINNTSKQNTVNFSFKHILSNVNFLMAVSPDLKADETNNPVSVNSITVGAVKMDGSYTYNTNAYKWTLAASPTTHTFQATQENSKVFAERALKAMTNNSTNSLTPAQISETPTKVPGLNDLLFVPQTLPTDTKYKVTIEYMIGTEPFSTTIDLNDFAKPGDNNTTIKTSEWLSGYMYNYILIIGPTPIEFDVTTIGGWANTDTYTYTIE